MIQTKNLKSRISLAVKGEGNNYGLDFPGLGLPKVGAVATTEGCSLFWVVDNLLYVSLEFPLKRNYVET